MCYNVGIQLSNICATVYAACGPADTGLLISVGKGLIVIVGFVWRTSMKNDIKCFHTIDVEINMV